MSDTTAGLLQVGLLIAALAAVLPPARRLHGAGLHERARPPRRAGHLPGDRGRPEGRPAVAGLRPVAARVLGGQRARSSTPAAGPAAPAAEPRASPASRRRQAFNTAASFVTNTNWQSYSGESTMGHLVQMAGLAVQNFVSAAVGMAVAVALIRGFMRSRTDRIGNFWVDLVRGVPAHPAADRRRSAALVLVATGAVQNFSAGTDAHHPRRRSPDHHRRTGRLPGGDQGARHQRRRLLQRQLRAPVREPERVHATSRDLPAAADPGGADPHLRADGRATSGRATPSWPRWRRSGRSSWPASPSRRPHTAAPRCSWPARRWRARRPGSASGRRRCSRPRPPVRRPAR